jgi:hypothetical protein
MGIERAAAATDEISQSGMRMRRRWPCAVTSRRACTRASVRARVRAGGVRACGRRRADPFSPEGDGGKGCGQACLVFTESGPYRVTHPLWRMGYGANCTLARRRTENTLMQGTEGIEHERAERQANISTLKHTAAQRYGRAAPQRHAATTEQSRWDCAPRVSYALCGVRRL